MNYGDFYYPMPVNEPVLSYAPGSKEKAALKAALKELKSTKIDVPMYIGGEEVRTGKMVEIRPPHERKHLLGQFHVGEAKHVTKAINAALKVILGKDVHQKGSNITPERMRFDFSCDHKLTDDEKKKVEDLVNEWISRGLDVKCEEMKKDDAIKSGAECMFIEKYPDIVTVYSIGNDKETVSKELCGGPHVKNTSELGHFKIKKEEASSAGVRRIKAILE